MADANLLKVLKEKESVSDVIVYGEVRCAIEKPSIVGRLALTEGFFAIVDVIALQCVGTTDDFGADSGEYDKNRIYFSKGSMLICCKNANCIGKLVKVSGKSKTRGCTIKRQKFVKNAVEGVHAFVFVKDRISGNWAVSANTVTPMTYEDLNGTVLEDYIVLGENSSYSYPESTEAIVEYCGASTIIEKRISQDMEIKGMFEYQEDTDERVDLSKIDMKLVKHLEVQPKYPKYDDVAMEIEDQTKKRVFYSKNLLNDALEELQSLENNSFCLNDIAEDIRESYIRNIASKYNVMISTLSKLKFKVFVDNLINSFYDARFATKDKSSKETEQSRVAINEGVDRIKKIIADDPTALSRSFGSFLPLLDNDTQVASLMVGNVTGVGESDLVDNHNSCVRYYGLDTDVWFFMLICYPYDLGLLGRSLKLVDCDKLYLGISKYYIAQYLPEKEYALNRKNMESRKYLQILEGVRRLEEETQGTFVMKSVLTSGSFEYYPQREKKYFKDYGSPLNFNNKEVVKTLLKANLPAVNVNSFVGKNPADKDALEKLEYMGILDSVGKNYLAFSKHLQKEFEIYKVLYEMGSKPTGVEDDIIDEAIVNFEKAKGFKLEGLQKEGIHLVKYRAAVLSGCAGSGKTTTSECMSDILEKNLQGYKIIYGTPTGKACRRLAEVVGGTVKTLHSLFGIGVGAEPYLSPVFKRNVNNLENRIYIFDEMAMCNSDLLYEVVRNLGDNDIVYFLGDVKQLPPIGRGIPFSMLMLLLPCVELGVSKRSASGSLVNYNCSLVNFISDRKLQELKYDNTSFVKRDCDDTMIAMEACNMFKDLMSGAFGDVYAEDDIQVITEYQTDTKMWSAPILNPPIQDFLRANDKLLFHNNDRKFYQNDRVIHLMRNSYEMRRYIKQGFNTFIEVPTFGAMNGEVGKLVTVQRTDVIEIVKFDKNTFTSWYKEKNAGRNEEEVDQEIKTLIEKYEEKQEDLRDDDGFNNDDFYFIEVEYYDNDLRENIIVLYRAHLKGNDSTFGEGGELYFAGGDLENLDLAYALTAHKMQGSQAQAVIAVFGKTGNPEFVNRNMINVIISRSQKFVGMIGNVTGEDSAVTLGRTKVSPRVRYDLLGMMTGEINV